MDTLVEQATQRNLDIAAAQARIEEADGQLRVAGAALLPTLGAGSDGGATRQIGLTGHERHRIYGDGTLQASYELDFWGKNRSARQAAAAGADVSRDDAEVVAIATEASVVMSYIALLGVRRQIEIVQDNLDRQRQSLAGMTTIQQAGLLPRLAVAQQDVVVQSIAATLPPLRQQAEHLRTVLAILTGVLPEQLFLRPEELAHLHMPEVVAGLPSQLLLRRPDVRRAESSLMAANANIRVARAAFFPSLNLTADGGIGSVALTHYTVPPLGLYSFGASLTQPIFEGGVLQGRLRVAKAVYQEDLAAYQKAALSAFGDVENALTDVKQLGEQEAAEQRDVASAAQGAQMALDAFHAGKTTELDALTGEDALLAAERSQVEAHVEHLQALVGLYQALGGGWSAPVH